MFLYLDKSILKCLSDPVPHNVVDGIQVLALMLRSGVHLVSGDREVLSALSEFSDISTSARAIFKKSVARHAQTGSVFKSMSTYALIDFGRNGLESSYENDKKIIKIPIEHVANLVAQAATDIVYEDVNDALVYDAVARWYSSTILNNPNLPTRSTPIQGGGSRTFAAYDLKQKDANTFCLCITDSDKKYPDDEPGETSSKVRNIEDAKKPLSFHLDLDFHEIENLIPLSFLDRLAGTEEAKKIIAELRKAENNQNKVAKLYWDFKKGLRGHYVKTCEGFRGYWHQALDAAPLTCAVECTLSRCDCFLIKPWPLKQDLKSAIERKETMDPSECEVTQNLWSEIGKTIVSWTISSSPQLA